MNKKIVFVSVPMSGKTKEEVKRALQMAKRFYIQKKEVDIKTIAFIDNYDNGVRDDTIEQFKNPWIGYLGRAVKRMAICDEVVFGTGWQDARGCFIEHAVCELYKIPMVIME